MQTELTFSQVKIRQQKPHVQKPESILMYFILKSLHVFIFHTKWKQDF